MRTPERNFREEDVLDRRAELNLFSELLRNAQGPYVISIDASWGTGKTYFIQLLKTQLEKEAYKTIYINAWESDYTTDPLLTIISELKPLISEDNFDGFLDKYLKTIAELVLPFAIKLATHGLINVEKIADGVSEIGEKLIQKKINEYQDEKKSIENLKAKLSEVAISSDKEKIIIFIDELDRCRPDYAIEFLERIKHFFDLKGYLFVISVDESQLLESIKSRYGMGFNAEKYLRRFIDYKYPLGPNIHRKYVEDTVKRIGLYKLIQEHSTVNESESIINFLTFLFSSSGLTARDVDQVVSKINIASLLLLQKENKINNIKLTYLLLFIKYINKFLYTDFINNKISVDLVIKELGLYNYNYQGEFIRDKIYIVSNLLFLSQREGLESEFYKRIQELEKDDSIPDSDDRKMFASDILDTMRYLRMDSDYIINMIKHL